MQAMPEAEVTVGTDEEAVSAVVPADREGQPLKFEAEAMKRAQEEDETLGQVRSWLAGTPPDKLRAKALSPDAAVYAALLMCHSDHLVPKVAW